MQNAYQPTRARAATLPRGGDIVHEKFFVVFASA